MSDHAHKMAASACGCVARALTQVWVMGASVETHLSMATSMAPSKSVLEPDRGNLSCRLLGLHLMAKPSQEDFQRAPWPHAHSPSAGSSRLGGEVALMAALLY